LVSITALVYMNTLVNLTLNSALMIILIPKGHDLQSITALRIFTLTLESNPVGTKSGSEIRKSICSV